MIATFLLASNLATRIRWSSMDVPNPDRGFWPRVGGAVQPGTEAVSLAGWRLEGGFERRERWSLMNRLRSARWTFSWWGKSGAGFRCGRGPEFGECIVECRHGRLIDSEGAVGHGGVWLTQ